MTQKKHKEGKQDGDNGQNWTQVLRISEDGEYLQYMHSNTEMNDEEKQKAGKQEGIINMAKDDIYFSFEN